MKNRLLMVMFTLMLACILALSSGCGQSSAGGPPDLAMTTSAAGLWIGVTDPNVGLEIQDGGFIKITRGGAEQIGKWSEAGPGQIKATFDGQESTLNFERRDLNLKITLPGESAQLEFTQM